MDGFNSFDTEYKGIDTSDTPAPDYSPNNIPEPIKRRSTWVRGKNKLIAMREALGQGLEIAGITAFNAERIAQKTQYRQDAVEDFNTQVIQEMTDKDVISAPEIIASRDGEDKLSARLDRDKNEITAQMVQTTMDIITGVVKPNIGESITTNGFYEFGNTYRYAVFPLSGEESFVDSGKGFFITLQGEIKISDYAKMTPVPSDRLSVGALGCNNTDDDVCFQSAFNLAKLRDCNVDVDVNIDIVGSIDVYRDGSAEGRRIIEFSGRGIITKKTSWYLFTNTLSRSGGNIKFNGIHFRSEDGAGTVIFHGGYLLRVYFENCHFLNVDRLTNALDTEPWNYLQTFYVDSSTFVGGKGWLIDAHTAYDVSFTHSIVEHRERFAKIDLTHSVRITDNLIEGIEGKVLEVKHGRSLVFDDNYMEHNGTVIEEPSITIDNPIFSYGFNEMLNISFKNNLYICTGVQRDNPNFYLMSIKNWGKSISVENNFCDSNFLRVENRHTLAIMPKSLIELYGNNISNAKYVINNSRSPKYLAIGSGNILSGKFDRPVSLSNYTFFNDSVNTKETQEQSLIIMQSPVGVSSNKIGLTIGNVTLARSTDYAIGVAASISDPNKESSGLKVVMREASGTIVYEDTLDISDIQLSDGYVTFYAMNHYRSAGANSVYIDVFIEPKSGNFSNTVSQRLSVSNVVLQRGHVATDFIG